MRSRLAQWHSHADGRSEAPIDLRRGSPENPNRPAPSETGLERELQESTLLAPTDIPLARVKSLQNALQSLFKLPTLVELQRGLAKLFMEVQWFTGFGQAHHFDALKQLGSCLETFISDLHHCEIALDSSSLRTLAHAVDLMANLSGSNSKLRLANRPCRVLVATATTGACQQLIEALEKVDIQTTVSANHDTCLRWAANNPLDMVIVNLEVLPDQGWQLCEALRNLPQGRALTVMPINAPTGLEQRVFAAARGCTELLASAAGTSEIRLRLITQALGKRVSAS